MRAFQGRGQAVALQGAPFDLAIARRGGGRGFIGTIGDLVVIALAWMIFIGVIFHPGAQLVGIAACGLALLLGSVRAAFGRKGQL
jgi:hypothetical protein